MSKMQMLGLVLASLAGGACAGQPLPARVPTDEHESRPQEIPGADTLMLPSQADFQTAARFANDSAMRHAIAWHLRGTPMRWNVVAAREIGDYVLLWIGFPDLADGGVDLVYSRTRQRIDWTFNGGVRG